MPVSPLARRFAHIFGDVAAQAMLAPLRPHSRISTFSFTATSLRHLRRVFDRLNDINNRQFSRHGNFLADPRAIGLVDHNTPTLSPAGQELLSYRDTLRDDPARGEYELLKTLYFGGHAHSADVQHLLDEKRDHMLAVLSQFVQRRIFLTQPSLLVIAEYIGSFPNALSRFIALGNRDLDRLLQLGENGFASLCSDPSLPQGLSYLCRRIGGEYTRAEERRLHQIVSMALLTIAQTIPPGGTTSLTVPAPYSNLLSEKDIFDLHLTYTSDLSVWPDGVGYQISTSLTIPIPTGPPIQLQNIQLQPQNVIPSGIGNAVGANHQSRKKRRGTQKSQTSVIINPLLSERAEDYVEDTFLRPQHGDNLVRVGHRSGEVTALPDGMVPGADFYALDAANDPAEFIEVKCTSGPPPTDVSLTRAEYLRACRCLEGGIAYRLILLDVPNRRCYEVADFAAQIGNLDLSQVNQFTTRLA